MNNGQRINLFNGFTLDLARGCVIRAGEPVHLRPQCYEVLRYLVENRGHLISKDRLIEEVWKGRAVTDDSLAKCIKELREALGPDAQQFVRNVRGRGYIFDTGVEESDVVLSARSEQVDIVRVVFEDEEETTETEATARGPLPPAVVAPRSGFEWSGGRRNAVAYTAAGVLVITVAVVVGYWFLAGRSSNSTPIKSIAVLPFANESGNPEVEYLSEGVAESLINRMSQLPGVKVIARSSSFKYKGKEVDPHEVARSLGVEAIMTGRVLQRGDNLIISAELVDARDGTQMWGEQYNRKESDLLLVQADISREIAETLRLRLTPNERQQLAKRETVNPKAYELLLKGRFSRSKGGGGGKKAVEYFNQAIAADPAYAVAYADLSAAYANLVTASSRDSEELMPKAESAAYQALELDESLAEAHSALAGIKLIAWDWAAAEREFKRAIELNPNLAGARVMYSLYLSLMGRYDQAIAEAKRARELDPLSLSINVTVANRFLLARQNDAAIEAANKALELDQNAPGPHIQLGYVYSAKGQYREAIAAYQEGIKLGNKSPDTQCYLGAAYALAGEREQARAILKRLEAGKEYVSPEALADLYVALGEREQAFAALERAYAEHDDQLMFLRVDTNLDPLRSDPRFQDLLRRVGFAQ